MEEKVVNMNKKKNSGSKALALLILVLVLAIVLVMNSFVIVNAGHRGVVLQLGAVKDANLTEGFHFITPFVQEVIPVEVRVQKAQSDQTAASKDMQTVTTQIAVNFHLNENEVQQLYKNVGLSYKERIIDPAIGESLKQITAQYTAEELITKRSEVSMKIKESLSAKLATYNMILDEINITEFKFSDEYNNAIEQKQIAEQQALKAELDLKRIEIEAEQTITEAKAEAESLKLQKEEITPNLIELRKIEAQLEAIKKWNGQLPSVTGGATPFINVDGLK